jgi:hypothetical protein
MNIIGESDASKDVECSFINGGNVSTRRKLPQVTDKFYNIMLYR